MIVDLGRASRDVRRLQDRGGVKLAEGHARVGRDDLDRGDAVEAEAADQRAGDGHALELLGLLGRQACRVFFFFSGLLGLLRNGWCGLLDSLREQDRAVQAGHDGERERKSRRALVTLCDHWVGLQCLDSATVQVP